MPGLLVLLSTLEHRGHAPQAKATAMPSAAACAQGAELLRHQVRLAFPGANVRTFQIDLRPAVPTLQELGAATT